MPHVCHGIDPRVFLCVLQLYCVVLNAKNRVSEAFPDPPNHPLPEVAPVVGKLLPPKRLLLCVGWNLILSADFYKGGHHALLNPKLQHVYHYSR